MYADKQRHAVDNQVAPGDKVLLKNTKLSGKLASNFETKPYTVQTKEGQELTLKSTEGVVQRRNSSFVKPYRTLEEPENPTAAESQADPVVSPSVADTTATSGPRRRPSRTIQMPAKFKDFVLDKCTVLKDDALLRLFIHRDNRDLFRILNIFISLIISLFLFTKEGNVVFCLKRHFVTIT